jgi:hypothetical protein
MSGTPMMVSVMLFIPFRPVLFMAGVWIVFVDRELGGLEAGKRRKKTDRSV